MKNHNSKLSPPTNFLSKSFPDLKINKNELKFICLSSIKWKDDYLLSSIFQSPVIPQILGGTVPGGKNMPKFLVILCSAVRVSVWKTIQIAFFTISKYFSQEIHALFLKI